MGITEQAKELVELLLARQEKIATAESCTGGLLAATLTEIAGCSAVFELGIVSYANKMKEMELGVLPETLAAVGAVSDDVACQMAAGVCRKAGADLGLGVTGIAGPGGGSAAKPVGLVYIGCCYHGKTEVRRFVFAGVRESIRQQALAASFALARESLLQGKRGVFVAEP